MVNNDFYFFVVTKNGFEEMLYQLLIEVGTTLFMYNTLTSEYTIEPFLWISIFVDIDKNRIPNFF